MTRRMLSAAALALLLVGACQRRPSLAHAFATPDAVASAMLEAVARRDRAALEALALDEGEFREHVWPALPAARPERNLPFSYVWGDLRQKGRAGLSATLAQFGGQRFTLARVTFTGETAYRDFRVHRRAAFVVRDAGGAESAIRVCGSMIEKDGMWKVFSYVVDD